jgi:hypothetical protein
VITRRQIVVTSAVIFINLAREIVPFLLSHTERYIERTDFLVFLRKSSETSFSTFKTTLHYCEVCNSASSTHDLDLWSWSFFAQHRDKLRRTDNSCWCSWTTISRNTWAPASPSNSGHTVIFFFFFFTKLFATYRVLHAWVIKICH